MTIVVLSDRMVQVLYPELHVWKVEMVRLDDDDVVVVVPSPHYAFFSTLD